MLRLTYPVPSTTDQVDDYHGTLIADPYRPLEDTRSAATRTWVAAQNELTARLLADHPARGAIRDRLAALWNFQRSGAPWRRGERWFQMRNTGLQDQDVLWTADGPEGAGRVLLDPNRLNGQGTTTLAGAAVSESGELAAIATSDAGSDWTAWMSAGSRPATLCPTGSSGASSPRRPGLGTTTASSTAAIRSRRRVSDDAPNRNMEVRYHRLGSDASEDRIVFATPHEPDWGFEPEVSDDGRLLVITVSDGTEPENRIYVADLANGADAAVVRPLLDAADAHYEHITTIDGTVYLLTDRDAPLGRVISVAVNDPDKCARSSPKATMRSSARAS